MRARKPMAAVFVFALLATGCDAPDDADPPPAPAADAPAAPTGPVALAVEPGCVPVGGRFNVVVRGLEPNTDYALEIDPLPHVDLEAGAMVRADGAGIAQLPGLIPPGSDPGEYSWRVTPADGDATLASGTFAVSESCP